MKLRESNFINAMEISKEKMNSHERMKKLNDCQST